MSRAGLLRNATSVARRQNPGLLGWGAIGLGAAAAVGGGVWIWRRHQAAKLVAETGVLINSDCTKMTVSDAEKAQTYFRAFTDSYVAALSAPGGRLGTVPIETLIIAASYMNQVAPGCAVTVTEAGIGGIDTWQKAALVGGLAILASGRLRDDGRLNDARFREQAEAIQAFLLEHGVDDLEMVEQVFEMPEGTQTPTDGVGGVGGGLGGGGQIGTRVANVGVIGAGLLGLGVLAGAGGGYFWWRNKKLTTACMGSRTWFSADGSLDPQAEADVHMAVGNALASGIKDPVAAADAAIVSLSGNADCRMPRLIWGDLMRLRAYALGHAVTMSLSPSPEQTGFTINADCTQGDAHDPEQVKRYLASFIDEHDFLQPGMTWEPSALQLSVELFERVAPQCGISISKVGSPTILGVDNWRKAALVGSMAFGLLAVMGEKGIMTQEAAVGQLTEILTWMSEHGLAVLNDVEKVWATPWQLPEGEGPGGQGTGFSPGGGMPGTGFGGGQGTGGDQGDDWGEPLENQKVDNGSVGGSRAALWRVYLDNLGEWDRPYYFKVWRRGQYVEIGSYDTPAQAKQAALAWIQSQPEQGGLAGNPRATPRSFPMQVQFNRGRTGPSRSRGLTRRMRARNCAACG